MLLDYPAHRQMQAYVKALNHFYLATPQLWEQDTDWRGFEWISHEDNRNNIIAFRRVAKDGSDIVVVVNFSPEEQQDTEAAMLCFWQSAWIRPQSSSRMASLSSQMQIWIIGWFPPFPF